MKALKALTGIFAGVCLSVAGEATLAGALTCFSQGDPACTQETQLNDGQIPDGLQFGNIWSDGGAVSALSVGGETMPRKLSWGHVLTHARVLHTYLFENELTVLGDHKDMGGYDEEPVPTASIDEPGTIALFSLGLLAIGVIHFRNRSRHP